MKITLIEKINNSPDVASFVFKPEKSPKWKAGQYIFYKIKHSNPDDRGDVRHFTISTAPYEKNLMLTTRFSKDRISTFKQALNTLTIGDEIEAFSPEGDFLIKNPGKKYVFIAGGIGITPYRSIVSDLNHKRVLNKIILLYANRDNEIIFKDELEKISHENSGFKIKYIIDPDRINAELIKKIVPDFSDYSFYISGTKAMVDTVRKIIQDIGVKNKSIKSDFFPGYSSEY